MDRRWQKTRAAILAAFTELLAHTPYEKLTVRAIIDTANVGRSTFYAHFETKDDLLLAVCDELFAHVLGDDSTPSKFVCLPSVGEQSVFAHLLFHLQQNDNQLRRLLLSPDNDRFLRVFKEHLQALLAREYPLATDTLPADFLAHHMASSFVEAVHWWLKAAPDLTPAAVADLFAAVIEPVLTV